jgi:SAM-dependent methyltransferase
MNPQEKTIKTYQNNFDAYKEKTPNVVSGELKIWLDSFIGLLPPNGKIFEIGSAHGRDARYLRDNGFSVLCTDVIPQALKELRSDNFETDSYDFRDAPKQEWIDVFDGVIAQAVFLHATQETFENGIRNLIKILKEKGIICLTFKIGIGEEIETDKLNGERYFRYYGEQELKDVFAKYEELEILETSTTEDGKWIQFILVKK